MTKPLTGYPADHDALNQAYCVSIGKRNAQEVHDAFLKGVEWQKRRNCHHEWLHPGTSPRATECAKCGESASVKNGGHPK